MARSSFGYIGLCATLLLAVPKFAHATDADPAARPALQTVPVAPVEPVDGRKWDGNHIGFLIGASYLSLDKPQVGIEQNGVGVRVAGRFSSIVQLLDVELGFEHSQFGGAGSFARNELGVQAGLHPGFPLTVFNDFIDDVFAGVHLFAGASLVRGSMGGGVSVAAAGGSGDSLVNWQPCVTTGIGMDIPISPRDRASGWWLTLRYALRWSRFGLTNPDLNFGDSQLVLLLGYRDYDTSFTRVPRPF